MILLVKRAIILLGILVLLFISGCGSDNNIEVLNKENGELKQKNVQLENSNKELAAKIDTMQKDNIDNQSDTIKNSETLGLIKREASVLRSTLADTDKKSLLLNMFNPYNLKVGDKIGNFTVRNLSTDDGTENVSFEGSFTVTGELVTNIIGGSAFSIILKKNEFNKIPYSIRQIDDNGMFFDVTNSEDEITSLLGKSYIEPEGGNEFKITITAVFSEYNYRFRAQTDMASRAKLVKLVSINN